VPKVSIITPCYNSEAFIGRTIESVRAQTLTDWEHIIVDDGSTDASAAVVEVCTNDPRLRLIRQTNGGVCNARNNGFKACSAESKYLLFLDADDCLEPEMLAVMTADLDQNPNVGLAYCDYVNVDATDKPLVTITQPRWVPGLLSVKKLPRSQKITPFVSVFCGAPVLASLSVLRRSIYEQTPGWDEDFGQHHEELNLFAHVALMSQVYYISQSLYRYRKHTGQSSSLPARHIAQSAKFDAKWKNRQSLSPIDKSQVEAAFRFRDRRLVPALRFRAGLESLQEGNVSQAGRHCLWAAMRYVGVLV